MSCVFLSCSLPFLFIKVFFKKIFAYLLVCVCMSIEVRGEYLMDLLGLELQMVVSTM